MVAERSRTDAGGAGVLEQGAEARRVGIEVARASPTTTSMPSGSARARTTAMVCGWVSASTKKAVAACLVERRIRVMASAAAVDSSSIEALAMSMPVRSVTIVWKLRSASSRPWLISGWYGV